MEKVLVLNADYSVLDEIHWTRAINLIARGKVEIVKYSDKIIRTITHIIKVPSVIKLIKLVRSVYKRKVPFKKYNVFVRDNFTCGYCGVYIGSGLKNDVTHNGMNKLAVLTIDHILPKSRGGDYSWENCISSCNFCNSKKGDKTPREAGMRLTMKPYAPTIAEFTQKRMEQGGVLALIHDLFM